jgi:hypothetical protein
MRPTLITIGLFFPGSIISLPPAFLCTTRVWESPDIALPISLGVGLISSLVCVGLHLKRHGAFSNGSNWRYISISLKTPAPRQYLEHEQI